MVCNEEREVKAMNVLTGVWTYLTECRLVVESGASITMTAGTNLEIK